MDDFLAVELRYKTGETRRFGPDEESEHDVPEAISFSTQIPGGFASASLTLPRPGDLSEDDKHLFSDVVIYGPGGKIAYEGRVVGIPEVDGEKVRLDLEGWSAHLTDDKTVRCMPVHQDFSAWVGPSTAFQLALAGSYVLEGPQITPDAETGQPSLELRASGEWLATTKPHPMAVFASPIPLSEVYYAWKKNASINSADTSWRWDVSAEPTDANWTSGFDHSGSLRSAGPGSGRLSIASTNRYVRVALYYVAGPAGGDNAAFSVFFTALALYEDSGLELHGEDTAVLGKGVLGSDVEAYVVRKFAPLLNVDDADIEATTEVIYHCPYLSPTNAQTIIEDFIRRGGAELVMKDWGVYEGRKYFSKSPGTYGNKWKVRDDDFATIVGNGPVATNRCESVFVTYKDGAGQEHTCGPVGSGAEYETDLLRDTDDRNPAVGMYKRELVDAGTTSQEGAVFIGRRKLKDLNAVTWKGTITVDGLIEDESGNLHFAWEALAGDTVVPASDPDREGLPIVQTTYERASLQNRLDVGSEPDDGDVMLAQLAAAAQRAGGV